LGIFFRRSVWGAGAGAGCVLMLPQLSQLLQQSQSWDFLENKPRQRSKKLDLPWPWSQQESQQGADLQHGSGAGLQQGAGAEQHGSQQSDFFDLRKRSKKLDLWCSTVSPQESQWAGAGTTTAGGFAG
jgi:hypothetical protein